MKMLSILFLGLSLLSTSSKATIEFTSASNVSAYDTGSTPKVYGGTSGTCASSSGTGVCDSCANATDFTTSACNRQKISSSTEAIIYFKVTSELSGTGVAKIFSSDGVTDLSVTNGGSTGAGQNDEVSVKVLWGNICNSFTVGASSDCSTNGYGSFRIGIDVNNDGFNKDEDSAEYGTITFQAHAASSISASACGTDGAEGVCGIVASPGDEKVVIDSVQTLGNYPAVTGINLTAVRVFYGTTFPTNPQGEAGEAYADLTVGTDSLGYFLDNNKITGLTNDTLYFFRPASVDQAGNVGFFVPDSTITAACDNVASVGAITIANDLNCPYAAMPSEVFGILEEDFNCFVATAAYGSAWHQNVADLRRFRDLYLKTSQIGRQFIEIYYTYGPYAAKAIAQTPEARAIARAVLIPFWFFAHLILHLGPPLALTVILFGLIFLILILKKSRSYFLASRDHFGGQF